MMKHPCESHSQTSDLETRAPGGPSINDPVRGLEVSEGGMLMGGTGIRFAVLADEDVLEESKLRERTSNELPTA